mmetsp:Transcript_6995/g.17102  ORF Transcript_6995/g.17102 Transcript_6995/m.17102 type:complete len:689 (+) Transcript_6995:303-2369(+)
MKNGNFVLDSDLPPGLSEMFINSTDTLWHREINQAIPNTWNDRPPLFFTGRPKRRNFLWRKDNGFPEAENVEPIERENPNLLKGMIRKGIPPSLRCALWLSNIIQSCRTDQDLSEVHEYRTLVKVRVVDNLYDSLWESDSNDWSNAVVRINRQDVKIIEFGNSSVWTKLEEEKCPGIDVVKHILFALHHSVLAGIIDYAPLLPTLVTILLGFMGESYAFYACREMYHHSAWFFATSRSEHIAMRRAFSDILGRLHPHTLEIMKEQDMVSKFTKEIFENFFTNVFPEWMVMRLMDIYSLEGYKVIYRFGVALAVLYGKAYKDHFMYVCTEPDKWWLGLVAYCNGDAENNGLNFEVLLTKAYGIHGRGVRKRFRFPRRPVLSRIIEIEEEKYRKERAELRDRYQSKDDECFRPGGEDGREEATVEFYLDQIEPLGLVIPPPSTDPNSERVVPELGESTLSRTKLAEWLPLSMRYTNLDLVYSSSYHGRTLENVYRRLANSRHTIFILQPYERQRNRDRYLVGMYASHTWRPSSRVYGDGRSFLFRIDLDDNPKEKYGKDEGGQKDNFPGSKSWKWHPADMLDFGVSESFDRENNIDRQSGSILANMQQAASRKAAMVETFQVSTANFLSLGGNEEGGAGLRLNEDLTKAESSRADGFDNEPLLPDAGSMFEVGLVEVYQLVRQMDHVPVR